MPKASSVRKPTKVQGPHGETKFARKKRATKTKEPEVAASNLPSPPSALLSVAPPPPGPSTGAVLFRTMCLDNVLERYPGLEIRSDFDLIELSGQQYNGTPAEIYKALDDRLARDVERRGYDFTMELCAKALANYVEPTGIKPKGSALGNKYVLVRPIPDSDYSLRIFPGSISAAEYCLDFVETATGKPVNSPFEYELWGVPNPDADTPWLSIPMVGKLRTLERGHGIKPQDVKPGQEKFVLRDGQTCVLMRPEKRPLLFTVPVRKMQKPGNALEGVDVVDFPRYIEP